MHIIGRIPHPSIGITLFHMNDKFILKMEAGPMEQVYKFTQEQISGANGLETIVDSIFLQQVTDRFNAMFLDMRAALERQSIHPPTM
jgi:hypothetical protein